MFYEIIGINLNYERKPEGEINPVTADCTVKMADSDEVKTVAVQLNEADFRQLSNLLRQRVDKTLNGE